MEFPIYQFIVAHLHTLTGYPLEQTGRLVGISFLFASLPAVFDFLAITGLRRSRRLIVLALILSSPVYLFYARTFMIETTALCFSVWFLALFRRALDKPSTRWVFLAALAAILAALTKITTFVVFGIPAAALALASIRESWSLSAPTHRLMLKAGISILLASLSRGLTWWWISYSDGVKDSNPFTGFLASGELHNWNYGPWALRGDWSYWVKIQENIVSYNLTEGAIALAVLCVPFATRRIRVIAGISVAGFFSGPLVFANLYHIHDYYYAANSLLLVGAAGLLLASIWDDARLPGGTNWLILSLMLIFQGYAFYRGYYSHHRNPAPPPPELAGIIRQEVPKEGVVLIYGDDWNPLLPYYCQRRAIMVPGEREHETDVLEQVLLQLPPRKVAAMVIHGERLLAETRFIQERAKRFGLDPKPFSQAGADELYLPASVSRVRPEGTDQIEALRISTDDDFPKKLKDADLAELNLSIFSPTPATIRSGYGVNSAEIDGRYVLNAHAPSELVFNPPAGASQVHAIVGLPDASYAPRGPAITNGITISIIAIGPKGRRQLLYQRSLDPAKVPTDRGPQNIRLVLPDQNTDQLIFRLGNGPDNNPTNDWAYWAGIEIK
jgi:hypothetical protein